jgi:NAD(P)H-hydrate repair Nnr-like enzyme with NAD(P)H-hydrate dehydratase domain
MVGALWARGLSPTAAAISGAYWHGVAASRIAATRTVTADLLAEEIGTYAW